MLNVRTKMLALGATALALSMAQPALAEGKADRAREAIAAAEAKLQAADVAGAGQLLTERQAKAREELAAAKEALANGHKDDAIAEANHVSMLAEANLGEAQHRKAAMSQARVEAAHEQVAAANQQAADAQAQAQDANARAEVAQNAAASSAAAADAARQAAAAAQMAANTPPPPTETSVTTTTARTASGHTAVRKKVVHTRANPTGRVAETTTTVVKTSN